MNNFISKIKNSKFITDFLTMKALAQLSKYLITGLLAAALEYYSFRLLNDYIKIWYMVSNPISMAVGFIVSFLLNRLWSFKSKSNIYKQLISMLVLFFINLCLSDAFFYIFTDYLEIPTSISKILVMGMVAFWNFIIYKKIIYRN